MSVIQQFKKISITSFGSLIANQTRQKRICSVMETKSLQEDIRGMNTQSNSPVIRLVLISDTHSLHTSLRTIPAGDILIHAGDFTESRPPKPPEYKDFIDWFTSQPHKRKVLISGNRDQLMDTNTTKKYDINSGFWLDQIQSYVKQDKSIDYLEDQPLILTFGEYKIHLYGTPWTAIYGKPGKAFQIPKIDLSERWDKIPGNTDILVTHMPPHMIRDFNAAKVMAGCPSLASNVLDRIKPKLHVFGHIHEAHGWEIKDTTLFVNAASKKPKSKELNDPVVIDYDLDSKKIWVVQQDEGTSEEDKVVKSNI